MEEQRELTLLETWRGIAYSSEKSQQDSNRFWAHYFTLEQGIYEKILANPDEVVTGTVKELAEKYGVELLIQKHYTLDENGNLTWDDDLYQKNEVPPALPWMQSLIDRNIFARNGMADLDSVQKVIERTKADPEFIKILLATERAVVKPINERYEHMLDDAEAIRVGVDKMYFVTSHHDLDDWLKVMARTGVEPKGILLYDDDQVVLENFASEYEGNHKELSQEIGRAVDVNEDFWRSEMGLDPEMIPRSGHRGQVLLESAVKRDKAIQLNAEGALETISL